MELAGDGFSGEDNNYFVWEDRTYMYIIFGEILQESTLLGVIKTSWDKEQLLLNLEHLSLQS